MAAAADAGGGAPPAARSRALEKAVSTLASGDFYEAQQLFKTVYHRQRSRKQLKDSYQTLQEGAELQLRAGHVTCGAELGLMLVEALTEDGVTPDADGVAPLLSIVAAFPAPAQGGEAPAAPKDAQASGAAAAAQQGGQPAALTDVEECSRVVAAAIKWANKQPQVSWQQARKLHAAFASYLWQQYGLDQLARVAVHVVRSGNATLHAQVLRTAAPPGALAAYLTQGVLQVLAIAKPHTKEAQLQHARSLHAALAPRAAAGAEQDRADEAAGSGKEGTTATAASTSQSWPPLCNFLGLLLEAIDRQSLALVRLLRDRYGPSLALDPTWGRQLARVEMVYLGARDAARAASGGLGGLLGQMLQGLQGLEEEDDDEDDGAPLGGPGARIDDIDEEEEEEE